jgi:hypothetical protein
MLDKGPLMGIIAIPTSRRSEELLNGQAMA